MMEYQNGGTISNNLQSTFQQKIKLLSLLPQKQQQQQDLYFRHKYEYLMYIF